MAIGVISTGHAAIGVGSTTGSFSLAIPDAGAHIFLAVGVDEASTQSVVPTWDSSGANSAFSLIAEQSSNYGALYLLADPSTGTHSILLNGLSSGAATRKGAVAIALSGVDSTTPYDALTLSKLSGGGSTSVASTAIPSETGDIVMCMVCIDGGTAGAILPDSSGTFVDISSNAAGTIQVAMAYWPGAATVLSSWATGIVVTNQVLIAVNVNASGAAATGSMPVRRRTLMGLGR